MSGLRCGSWRRHLPLLGAVVAATAWSGAPARAADVTGPAEATGLTVGRSGADLTLSWDAVTVDAAGNPETVDHYAVYRGDAPDFVADRAGGSNRIATPAGTAFTDAGAAEDGVDHYYLVSAVDTSANEGITRPSVVTTPPVLSGNWTATTIDLSWTDAEPSDRVFGYRVYYGRASGNYEFVDDVGLVNAYSVTGLETNVNWYFAVTAIACDLDDPTCSGPVQEGNESGFSNEHVDAVAGTIEFRGLDALQICNGCGAQSPDEVVRRNGHEKSVEIEFPEGDWVNIQVTWSLESRLCDNPEVPDRCGEGNPGWNPCGDPWDRTAILFLVEDDCVETGAACSLRHDNVELLHAITPFGTDAPAPDGNGRVGPRVWTFDLTPLKSLLVGRKHVGVHISTWVSQGWWNDVDFHFSEDPAEASPKPPADGVQPVIFHDGGNVTTPRQVTIPATATQVFARYFVSGHGANAPNNCDEFCQKTNRILVDGAPAFQTIPWRDCCWPRGSLFCEGCQDWNSCGYPSCTFDRSGWCPGEIACHYNIDEGCDQDLDATEWLAPGGTYDVTYDILNINGSWTKSLLVYWYE